MHQRAGSVLIAVVLGCLAACGGAPEPQHRSEAQEKAEAQAHGRDTDKTVFDDMVKTQDKARAVEDVTMKAKAATDAAIEQSEGDSRNQ